MIKIVILDGYTANPGDLSWSGLEQLGNVTVYKRTAHQQNETIDRIGSAEAVFTNKVPITREVLAACPQLKYVGVLATGYNVVDIEAAREYGVTVTNVPGYSTDAVVQMVFAHILNICFHVTEHSDAVYKGQWQSCEDFSFWNFPLMELNGKTLGIIGMGEIGCKVAKIAKAFGMHVIATTRTRRPEHGALAELVPLEALFAQADIISVHCPLTDETQGLINAQTIEKMKPGVVFINTSRGPIVVEQDLCDALKQGKIAYAGVDVVSSEPIDAHNPLLEAPNCYITPHIAWAPKEARMRLIEIAVSNLDAWKKGNPVHVVS